METLNISLKKRKGAYREEKKLKQVNSHFRVDPSSLIKLSSNQTFSLDGCHLTCLSNSETKSIFISFIKVSSPFQHKKPSNENTLKLKITEP